MLPIIYKKFTFHVIEKITAQPITKCFLELNKSQWYTYDQLKLLQWEKLKKLISHCYYNIPFYKETFKKNNLQPKDITNLEDIKKIPCLTKEIVRSNYDRIIDKNYVGKIEHGHSGGTLGMPLNFIRDSLGSAYTRACQLRGLSWFSIAREARQLRIWGLPFDMKLARKERIKDFLLNRFRISAFEIRRERIVYYYKIIKKLKPTYIYGFTSAIYKICQLMQEMGLKGNELGIKYVVTTTETLFSHQKKCIENFFNCRVINEYGCSEMGVIAFECPYGNLHISMENIVVEFEEIKNSESQEIILTNLNSFSMPLLRYKIGDTGRILKSNCPCGRKLEIMDFDAGRVLSTLIATDGHFVVGNVFCYIAFDIIKRYKGIKDFRVIQKERNKIEITLSKDEKFSEHILDIFTRKIKELLGQDMIVEYKFVEEIPLEKSGKRLFVYSDLEIK